MIKWTLAIVGVLLMAGAVSAQEYQDIQFTSYEEVENAFATQQEELATLTARLAALEEATETAQESPETVGVPAPAMPTYCCPPTTCCCNNQGGLTFGAGALALVPRWSSNPAYYYTSAGGTTGVGHEVDFANRIQVAPYVWAGFSLGNGIGLRTTWFEYDNSTAIGNTVGGTGFMAFSTPNVGGSVLTSALGAPTGARITATDKLYMNVFDFEGTKSITSGRASYLLSGGLRYANIGEQYAAQYTFPGGTPIANMRSGHDFNGAGPTIAALSHYPLGNTGIGLYARGRAAAMYGRRHGTFYTTNATGGLTSGEQLSAQAVLPYTDMEVGLDWNRSAGYSTLFAQVGFVGQAYYGIGNPASSSTVGPLGAAPGTFGGPTANDMSNLVLIGLRATAGVNF